MVLLSLWMTRCRGVWPLLVGWSTGNLYFSTKSCRHSSLPLWAAKWMAVKPCGGQRRAGGGSAELRSQGPQPNLGSNFLGFPFLYSLCPWSHSHPFPTPVCAHSSWLPPNGPPTVGRWIRTVYPEKDTSLPGDHHVRSSWWWLWGPQSLPRHSKALPCYR